MQTSRTPKPGPGWVPWETHAEDLCDYTDRLVWSEDNPATGLPDWEYHDECEAADRCCSSRSATC